MKLPSFEPSAQTPVLDADTVGVRIAVAPAITEDAKVVPLAGSYRIPAVVEDKDLSSLHADVMLLLVDAAGPAPRVRAVVPALPEEPKLPERVVDGHRVGVFTVDLLKHFGVSPVPGARYHVVASLRRWTSPLVSLTVAA